MFMYHSEYPVSDNTMVESETYDGNSEESTSDIKNFKIKMTSILGIGAGVLLIAYLTIYKSTNAAAKNVEKLLIDTDAGADDAVAILMALKYEEINNNITIMGITCVNGNTYVDNVVINVLKTLKVVDRLDIPVYKGANRPLLLKDEKNNYFGKDGFGDFYYPDPVSIDLVQDIHAVDAMIEMVKTNPGELTLLALGPLTNIALAIRIYSSFIDDLRQLIILGGSSEGIGNIQPGIEFNFGVDPVANYIVFEASMSKPVILVPYETTKRTQTPMEFRTSFNETNNKKIWLINSAESLTLNPEDEYWQCPDAVAATIALTSGEIVTRSKKFYSDAIFEGQLTAGMIVIDYSNLTQKNPNINLIQDIDSDAYENMLLTLLS